MSPSLARARRVAVTEQDPGGGRPDYASAFEVTVVGSTRWSPEQWARSTFEDAPRAVRWFVVAGWRGVLGLRLGPAPSPGHVLGWTILTVTPGAAKPEAAVLEAAVPEAITLEVRSVLLTARKVLRVQDSRVVATTFVHYEHPAARVVWAAVAPVHHRTEPYLLGRAASQLSAS